jgi:hypothetical protein
MVLRIYLAMTVKGFMTLLFDTCQPELVRIHLVQCRNMNMTISPTMQAP